MPEYVRVKDKETGHHVSILRSQYERESDLWQELKQPATDAAGDPMPVKHHTSVSAETAKSASQSAATSSKKEN